MKRILVLPSDCLPQLAAVRAIRANAPRNQQQRQTLPQHESYDLAPQPGELIGRRRNGLDRNTLRIDCRRSFEE